MDDEDVSLNSPQLTTAVPITRRAFGQTLGIAAVAASTLPGLAGTVSAQSGTPRPTAAASDQLCDLSAIELTTLMRKKELSARDVMTAHLAQIERINPRVNAIVTLADELAWAGLTTTGMTKFLNNSPETRAVSWSGPTVA